MMSPTETLGVYDRAHRHVLRERIAAKMHETWVQWTKNADNHNTVDRGFLFCPYDELNGIDKLAPLRDADEILDIILNEVD